MATRKAITKAQAVKYRSRSRAAKSEILDVVCAVTGFNRDYARRVLTRAVKPGVSNPEPREHRSTRRKTLPRWRNAGRWPTRHSRGCPRRDRPRYGSVSGT